MANGEQQQLKLLRDQVARLISQNLELRRQLDDFEREQTGLTLEEVAAVFTQALRSADAALAATAPDESRYAISELQTSLRGFLARQGSTLTLRTPRPEQTVPTDNLGNLQFTLQRVPPPTTPTEILQLGAVLEDVQSAFSAWRRREGAAAAQDIVAWSTHLHALLAQWEEEPFPRTARALAEAALRWSQALPATLAKPSRAAAAQLSAASQSLAAGRRVQLNDLALLAAALHQLAQACRSVIG